VSDVVDTAALAEQHPTTLALELLAGVPDVVVDPYHHYKALRDKAPVHRVEMPEGGVFYVLTRYEDSKAVLAGHAFGKGDRRPSSTGMFGQERPEAEDPPISTMLFLDPPDHTRIRGLFSRAFTPRRIEALKPRIDELVADMLEPLRDGGEVDLLDTFGFPVPVAVIGELVGVPAEDWPRFRTLVRNGAASLELNADMEVLTRARASLDEMGAYFDELIAERRSDPQDDLLSALIAVEEAGDRIQHDELVANVILLFAAGFETTTNLIGNGMVALLRHPDALARLRADRSLLAPAVEEILRYDSPVQLDGRAALTDAALPDGTAVAKDEFVITLLGAANRDPARFDDPDRFDIGRTDNAPLSFSWGIHHCLGANLARAEGYSAFGALLDTFADVELLDDPPAWRRSLTLRGLDRLRVRLTPA
jgi:cytochrome P450